MGPVNVAQVKWYLDKSDGELASLNLARAPGRNPPIMQTNFTLPEEEEKPYWPFIHTEYLPLVHRHNPNWYTDTWGTYGT